MKTTNKTTDSWTYTIKFDTEEEAREAANNSSLGEQFGFEIFEIGSGS
jgi:hypothetical protein